jgi:hypothetical protein
LISSTSARTNVGCPSTATSTVSDGVATSRCSSASSAAVCRSHDASRSAPRSASTASKSRFKSATVSYDSRSLHAAAAAAPPPPAVRGLSVARRSLAGAAVVVLLRGAGVRPIADARRGAALPPTGPADDGRAGRTGVAPNARLTDAVATVRDSGTALLLVAGAARRGAGAARALLSLSSSSASKRSSDSAPLMRVAREKRC